MATTKILGLEITAATASYAVTSSYALNGGGSAAWGGITGTLSTQTDLQTELTAKQNKLILFCTSSVTTVTGSTSETLIASVAIPTTINNAMLRSSFIVRVVTLGVSARSRIRIGTVASPTAGQITAATIIATNSIGSLGMASIYRTMPVIGGVSGSIKAVAMGSNVNADYGTLAAFDIVSRDFTTQQYLYYTVINGSVAGQSDCYGILVENIQ